MLRSLRLRLFLGVCLVSVVVLGILSAALDTTVQRTLQEEFDRSLLEKARSLASMVEQSGAITHFDYQPNQFPEFEVGPRPAFFEIYLDHDPYQHSASLADGHLPAAPLSRPIPFTLPNGRPGRLLTFSFQPLIELDDPAATLPVAAATAPLPHCLLVVAQDSADLSRTVSRLHYLTLALCAAATLLSGIGLILVTGRAIRPVRTLARQIESFRETDLAPPAPAAPASFAAQPPLSATDFPTELVPIVDRLNALLARLAEAFARERAFTADVAHELRTPLAGILATLQVARSRPRDSAAYEFSIDKSLAILTNMQSLIENLLLLARADGGQLAVRKNSIDLSALAQECRLTFADAAAQRHLHLDLHEQAFPPIVADRELLRIVLHNLLDNAVSYATRT